MLLPQRSQGGTLENHMLFVANSTTVASHTNPVSPIYMAGASKPAGSNWQAITAQINCKNRCMRLPETGS